MIKKRFIKSFFKKSLSLVMAVLMLMSCWVWGAPEHNHASAATYSDSNVYTSLSDIESINSGLLGQINNAGSTTIKTTYGKYFTNDSDDNEENAANIYNNLLWSGQAEVAGSIKDGLDGLESFSIYYPKTVLMDDGRTNPTFGISLLKDAGGSGCDAVQLVHFGTSVSSDEGLGLEHYWYGFQKGSSGHIYFLNAYCGTNKLCGYTEAKKDLKSELNYYTGDAGEWYWLANKVVYSGKVNENNYYEKIIPDVQTHLGSGAEFEVGNNTILDVPVNVPIYVIKTDTLLTAYGQIDGVKTKIQENPSKYTPASVEKFKDLVNALYAANPNKYTNTDWSNTEKTVSTCAAEIKTAVDNWNNWLNNGGLVEIKEVKWNDGDGKLLETVYCGDNQNPAYSNKTTPTKTPDPTGYNDAGDKGWQYTYTFNKTWTTATTVDSATNRKIETHTANFDRITNFYVVTFDLSGDRTDVVKTYTLGSTIPPADIPALSERVPDENYHYSYKWDPAIGAVTSDITYKDILAKPYEGHNYGEWFVTKDATCKDEGSKYQVCTIEKCKYVHTVAIEKTAHNLTKVDEVASTCTVQGNKAYWYCSECKIYYGNAACTDVLGKDIEGTKLPLAGHAFGRAVVIEGDEVNHTLHCTNEGCTKTKIANHSYTPMGMANTATCVTPGITHLRCTCGMTKQQDGALYPDNHEKLTVVGKKDATCDVPGYTGDTYCLACDKDMQKILEKGEEIPALGHSFTKYQSQDDATCTKDGTKTAKCDRCDVTDTQPDVGSALGHNWTNTEEHLKSEANCIDNEVYYKECSRCQISSEGETEETWEKVNTKWNHKFDGDYVSNDNGTHAQKCTNTDCIVTGNEKSCTYSAWTTDNATTHSRSCIYCKYTPAAENHDWTEWTSVDANAVTKGEMTRECKVCGRTEKNVCTYDSVYTPATCLDDAYTTYTCKDCGHGYTVIDKGSAKGHNFTGEYKFDKAEDKHQQLCANGCGAYGVGTEADKWADCTWSYTNKEDGKHTAACLCGNGEEQACSGGTATCTDKATCEFCKTAYGSKADHLFEGDIVALGNGNHAYRCEFCKDQTIYGVGNNVGDSVPCSGGSATCTTLATCEECKASYGELKADAHKWGAPVPEKNDTEHTHKYTCEYNGEHTKTEACAPAVDYVVAPTCEVPGYTVQKCQLCSATWNTDPTEALGHSWGDWVSNENGTHTRTCVRLGCCYGENDAAKTETAYCTKENATVVVTDPTCTVGGFSTYTCNLCDYDWVDDNTAALGHDYSKKIYTEEYLFEEQNCTQGNIYFFACSRCDKNGKDETDLDKYTNLKFEADKPLGHKWVENVDEKYRKSYATCDTAAVYYKSCEACGISSEETFTVTEAYGHEWVQPSEEKLENFIAVEPDCETDAQYYYVCERCRVSSKGLKTDGETWTVVSDKPGHSTLIEVAGVAGNCEKDTTIAHWYCKDCGKKFKDANGDEAFVGSTIIKAPGHSWIKYSAVDATCETDGHAAYDKCSVCGATKGTPTVYPKKGHNFTADAGYYIDEVNDYHAFYCANAKCLPATDDNGEAIKDAKGRSVYNKAYGIAVDGQQIKYTVTDNGDGTVTVSGGIKCSFDNSTITTVDGVHSHNDVCVCSNSISTVYTDESPKTVAPTCVDYGYKLHTCSVCKTTWQTDMVEPNGHTLATTGVSNGDGTHSLKCIVETCSYKKDTVKCSGGTATCKDQAVCDICKGPYGDTLPHTLSDSGWTYNGNAKCGVDGTESQKCSVCGETETRTKVGSALNHELLGEYTYDISGWESKPADFNLDIKEPNCKENGLTINYCTNAGCGYYKTKIVKASASYHKFTETTTAGTCTTGAVTTKVCSVCNYTERTTSEAADHQWMETGRDLPNCTNSGCIYYLCTVCKEEVELDEITADFTDSNYVMFMGMKVDISGIKAKGHKWGNLEIEKAATCSREGRGNHSCNVCGKGEKVDIPVIEGAHIIGHKNCTLKRVPASAPTCKAQGNREYYECMSCPYSQNANDDYTLDPVGHKDNDGDGRCDYCYDPMDKATINDGCICHKTGFSAFIYKILRIFWKLFKIKKSCDCGAVHY